MVVGHIFVDDPQTLLILGSWNVLYPTGTNRQLACSPLRPTFQELAEVKVVLCDHVGNNLLVKAYDLEQSGFQKNGFCVVCTEGRQFALGQTLALCA